MIIKVNTDFGGALIPLDKVLLVTPQQQGQGGSQILFINGTLIQCTESLDEIEEIFQEKIMTAENYAPGAPGEAELDDIDDPVMQIRPEIRTAAGLMEMVLKKDYGEKQPWKETNHWYLFGLLNVKMRKLKETLDRADQRNDFADIILKYCIEVMNHALFIALNAGELMVENMNYPVD